MKLPNADMRHCTILESQVIQVVNNGGGWVKVEGSSWNIYLQLPLNL